MKIKLNNKIFHSAGELKLGSCTILINNEVMEQLTPEDMKFFEDWIVRCEGEPGTYKLDGVPCLYKGQKGILDGVWPQAVGYNYGIPYVNLMYDQAKISYIAPVSNHTTEDSAKEAEAFFKNMMEPLVDPKTGEINLKQGEDSLDFFQMN